MATWDDIIYDFHGMDWDDNMISAVLALAHIIDRELQAEFGEFNLAQCIHDIRDELVMDEKEWGEEKAPTIRDKIHMIGVDLGRIANALEAANEIMRNED